MNHRLIAVNADECTLFSHTVCIDFVEDGHEPYSEGLYDISFNTLYWIRKISSHCNTQKEYNGPTLAYMQI